MLETSNAVDPLGGLSALFAGLDELDQNVDDATRIDRLRAMEEAKAALAAAQAREAVAFAASQRAAQAKLGVPAERAERGIAEQIALALRRSPWQARRFLSWSWALCTELPETFIALSEGRTTERRALTVARETMFLSREDRASLDEQIAPTLERLGDKQTEAEVKRLAYRLDPVGYTAKVRGAEDDRCVSLRPAPDMMSRLDGLLPVAQGVAAFASLNKEADRLVAAGDSRNRGQIMADTMVERLTSQSTASAVSIEVGLIMTDRALLTPDEDGGDEPAMLEGMHPIPAELARALVVDAPEEARIWLRRLYTRPADGQLVAMDSQRREWTAAQRRFIRVRDQICRTPWCDAPVRHIDHVKPAGYGGPTQVDNGQGYCQACNYAKQAPGWRNKVVDSGDGPHEVEITTPTGHTYRSRAPDPPRAA